MHEDRTLFGSGRYPDTGPLAVLARLAFVVVVVSIVIAVFLPPWMVPDFVRSHYLQHFAGFYVLLLSALAAMPRSKLRRMFLGFVVFASLLEATHLINGAPFRFLVRNWVADIGGLSAAIAPVVVERYRRRFPRPEA
jgi:hypothetical protein